MFADNIALYCVIDNHDVTAESINDDIECICQKIAVSP